MGVFDNFRCPCGYRAYIRPWKVWKATCPQCGKAAFREQMSPTWVERFTLSFFDELKRGLPWLIGFVLLVLLSRFLPRNLQDLVQKGLQTLIDLFPLIF